MQNDKSPQNTAEPFRPASGRAREMAKMFIHAKYVSRLIFDTQNNGQISTLSIFLLPFHLTSYQKMIKLGRFLTKTICGRKKSEKAKGSQKCQRDKSFYL
jgi:hypothetical protein